MAQAHAIATEGPGPIHSNERTTYVIRCACDDVFEGEGRSALDARTQALTSYQLHLHG